MRFETSPSRGQRWACPAERTWLHERAADNFRPAVDPQPHASIAPSVEVPAGSNSAEAVLFPHLVRLEE